MKTIEIKHRWTGAVIYSAKVEDADEQPMRTVLERAVKAGANLRSANLRSADLSWANLGSADLRSANLRSADLRSADLSWANLGSADLSWADLSSADLSSADLSWADLSWANLSWANLSWSEILASIRDDIRSILDAAPAEVSGLLSALNNGRIDGSVYEGECACLVGTIAKLRGCEYLSLPAVLSPDSSRPAERWFVGISRGHTPDNNPIAALAHDWIVEWMAERGEGPLHEEAP